VPGQAARPRADDRAADDCGREDDPDERADRGPRPGAVLGRLLGLRHADLAIFFLSDHRGVEGPDRSGSVEVEHGFVVGFRVGNLVVDGGVQEYGPVGHFSILS
jgi:hypothetical protein